MSAYQDRDQKQSPSDKQENGKGGLRQDDSWIQRLQAVGSETAGRVGGIALEMFQKVAYWPGRLFTSAACTQTEISDVDVMTKLMLIEAELEEIAKFLGNEQLDSVEARRKVIHLQKKAYWYKMVEKMKEDYLKFCERM